MRVLALLASVALIAASCDDVIIDDYGDEYDDMPTDETIVIISENSNMSEEEVRDFYGECLAEGGKPVLGGFGQPSCEKETSDGGEFCEQNSDCESFCLAETNTCAPSSPAFGCQEVLPRPGMPATICVD